MAAKKYLERRWKKSSFTPKRSSIQIKNQDTITQIILSEEKIITSNDKHSIHIYDINTGDLELSLTGHRGAIWHIKLIGSLLLSVSSDLTMRIWDLTQGICTHIFRGHTDEIKCLDIIFPAKVKIGSRTELYPEEPLIVTAGNDCNISLWRIPSEENREYRPLQHFNEPSDFMDQMSNPYFVETISGHLGPITDIAVHGNIIVSGSEDKTVRVWDIEKEACRYKLEAQTKVYSVLIDSQRSRCICGTKEHSIKMWDLESGTRVDPNRFQFSSPSTLRNSHGKSVTSLRLAGDYFVSSIIHGGTALWDAATGKIILKSFEAGNKRNASGIMAGIFSLYNNEKNILTWDKEGIALWGISTSGCRRLINDKTATFLHGILDERRCVVVMKVKGRFKSETSIEVFDFATDISPKISPKT